MRAELDSFRSSFGRLPEDVRELEFLRPFLNPGDRLFVHERTGVVSAGLRMSPREVLNHWSSKVFSAPTQDDYSATFPYAAARQLYVWRTLKKWLKMEVRAESAPAFFVDFAGGECAFAEIVKRESPHWDVASTESAPHLVSKAREVGQTVYAGGLGLGELPDFGANVGSLMWTLSCALDPFAVLDDVWHHTADDGILLVAESSRVMVPFKKSLADLLNTDNPADCHPYYFSARSLQSLLKATGFEPVFVNRYFDSDVLLVIARKVAKPDGDLQLEVDDPELVYSFFQKWEQATAFFEALR